MMAGYTYSNIPDHSSPGSDGYQMNGFETLPHLDRKMLNVMGRAQQHLNDYESERDLHQNIKLVQGYDPVPSLETPLKQKHDWQGYDRLWHFAFTSLIVGLIVILMNGSINGSLSNLFTARNYQGLACGWEPSVAHLPYLYLPIDPADGKKLQLMSNRAMCVRTCPTQADVDTKAFISISDASAVRTKHNAAFINILHPIRSPVYATTLERNSFCIPQHPELAIVARKAFGQNSLTGGPLRAVATNLLKAVPVSIVILLLTIVASAFFPSVVPRCAPVAAVSAVAIAVGALAAHGIRLIFSHTINQERYALPGLCCLLAAGGLIAWFTSRIQAIREAACMMSSVRDCFDNQLNMGGAASVLGMIGAATSYASIIGFCLVQSQVQERFHPIKAAIDPNGGLDIYPLERPYSTPLGSTTISCIFITLATTWALEVMLGVSRYVASFAANHHYFAPKDLRGRASDIPANLVVLSTQYAITRKLGTLSAVSAMKFITRPFRILLPFGMRHGAFMEILSPSERHPAAQGNDYIHNLCRGLHGGIYCELVCKPISSSRALALCQAKANDSDLAPVSSLLGLTSLFTWCFGACIWSVGFVVISSSLLRNGEQGFNKDLSSLWSPFIAAAVLASTITYVGCMGIGQVDAIADSLLYSAMIDHETRSVTNHQNGKYTPETCPNDLFYAIRSRPGGCKFMPWLAEGSNSSSGSEIQTSQSS